MSVREAAWELREFLYLARGLRAYARRRTPRVRKVFGWLLRLSQAPTYLRRRALGRRLSRSCATRIPESTGILDLTFSQSDFAAAAVAEANGILAGVDLERLRAESEVPHRVAISLAGRLGPDSAILRLALHPSLLGVMSSYVGMLPVIEGVYIWYSPNERMVEGSSQFYHLDGQDLRTLQVFVFLDDVTVDSGPLTALSAAASEHLCRAIGYRKNERTRRIPDELVERLTSPEDVVALTGPKGSVFVVDTDRCFHYGSRAAGRPRRLLVIQYYSPFAFVLPRNWSAALPFAALASDPAFSETERQVLGARS